MAERLQVRVVGFFYMGFFLGWRGKRRWFWEDLAVEPEDFEEAYRSLFFLHREWIRRETWTCSIRCCNAQEQGDLI